MVKRKIDPRPGLGFDPDPPAVSLDDTSADSKAHAGAGVGLVRVKAFEEPKDSFLIFCGNPYAVILDAEQPVVILSSGRKVDM